MEHEADSWKSVSEKSLTEEVLGMLNDSHQVHGLQVNPIFSSNEVSAISNSSSLQRIARLEFAKTSKYAKYTDTAAPSLPKNELEELDDIDRAIGEAVLGPEAYVESKQDKGENDSDDISVGELLIEDALSNADVFTKKHVPEEFKKTKVLNRSSMGNINDLLKGEQTTMENIKCFLDKYIRQYELDAGLPNVTGFLQTLRQCRSLSCPDEAHEDLYIEFDSRVKDCESNLDADESAVILAFCELKNALLKSQSEDDISKRLYNMEFIVYLHAILCVEKKRQNLEADVHDDFEKTSHGKEIEGLRKHLKEAKLKYKNLEKKIKDFDSSKTLQDALETNIHRSKQAHDKELTAIKNKAKTMEKTLEKTQKQLQTEKKQFQEMGKRLEIIFEKREKLKKRLKAEEETSKELNNEVTSLRSQLLKIKENKKREETASKEREKIFINKFEELSQKHSTLQKQFDDLKGSYNSTFKIMQEDQKSREEEISRLDLLIEEINEELSKSNSQLHVMREKCAEYLSLLKQVNDQCIVLESENVGLKLSNGEIKNKFSLMESHDREVIDDVSSGLLTTQRHNVLLEEATSLLEEKLKLKDVENAQLRATNESLRSNLISVQEINNKIIQWSGCVFYEDSIATGNEKQTVK